MVVSPLVSLMEDQVMALRKLGVRATLLNANAPLSEVNAVAAAMTADETSPESIRIVYVTPEKLAKSKTFMNKLEKAYSSGRLNRIAIDEVHCCSQWGHDFRPDFKFLRVLRTQFPETPIIGLTATATERVLKDVRQMLELAPDTLVLRSSFNRANLFYEVLPKPATKQATLTAISDLIRQRFKKQSGIVYVFSQKDAEEVGSHLQSQGIRSAFYHADIPATVRSSTHRKWIDGEVQVVVATIAFGMGIDKPDVRFVIHHCLSKSLENYYQESGRAGRDDKRADCILFFKLSDLYRLSGMVFAEQGGLVNLYRMVEFAAEQGRCRRQLIAKYFGEAWSGRDTCSEMCDMCAKTESGYCVEEVDVTDIYQRILQILEQNTQKKSSRLTGNKLLDMLVAPRMLASLTIPETDKPKRDQLELVLAQLLIKDYLKEEFHFTAYSTVSYVTAGHKSALSSSITVPMRRRRQLLDRVGSPLASTLSSTRFSSISFSKKRSKPESVIIDDDDDEFDFGDSASLKKLSSKRQCTAESKDSGLPKDTTDASWDDDYDDTLMAAAAEAEESFASPNSSSTTADEQSHMRDVYAQQLQNAMLNQSDKLQPQMKTYSKSFADS